MLIPGDMQATSVAVLVSGGVESATLTALCLSRFGRVHPVYVRCGLAWEQAEEACLRRFLDHIDRPGLQPLTTIELTVRDVYGPHWSTTGQDVPDDTTPDEAVCLPGRNLILLSKTAIWCSLKGISTIALGHLGTNPFPDATDGFFSRLEELLCVALDFPLRIIRPLAHLRKPDVIRLGADLPLECTFSCIHPVASSDGEYLHCARCNKCAERIAAFAESGVVDRTRYGNPVCRPDRTVLMPGGMCNSVRANTSSNRREDVS
ncbi:MAG TPA: 7-cyano-7-deazaguanine synthase [Candidatus Obscuribacterales bacterium]